MEPLSRARIEEEYPEPLARSLATTFLKKIPQLLPKVTRVIFNGPATIVFWDDGEKTVVRCSECGDGRCLKAKGYERDPQEPPMARPLFCEMNNYPEKAIMAAMLKRVWHNYQDTLREFVPEEGEDE